MVVLCISSVKAVLMNEILYQRFCLINVCKIVEHTALYNLYL